jgi:hypothetical protein
MVALLVSLALSRLARGYGRPMARPPLGFAILVSAPTSLPVTFAFAFTIAVTPAPTRPLWFLVHDHFDLSTGCFPGVRRLQG